MADDPQYTYFVAVNAEDERTVKTWLRHQGSRVYGEDGLLMSEQLVGWTYNYQLMYWEIKLLDLTLGLQFAATFRHLLIDLDSFDIVTVDGKDDSPYGLRQTPMHDQIAVWCELHCKGSVYFIKSDVVFDHKTKPVHVLYRVGFSDPSIAVLCKLTYG